MVPDGAGPVNRVQDLIVQDVRCFEGAQSGRLRPITLLVGENSTGKSTFLACHRILSEVLTPFGRSSLQPDFNEEPFLMGSFRDIVRSRRGPKGRGDEFKLGFTIDARESNVSSFELWIAFSEEGSQPHVSAFRWDFGGTDFLEIGAGPTGRTVWRIPDHEASMDLPFQFFRIGEGMFVHGVHEPGLDVIVDYLKGLFPDRTGNAWFLSETLCPPPPNLVPSAPLRSKPARTYNPVREMPSSEGAHVPMLMMRLDRTDRPHWNELHGDLVAFGRESGMFSDVKVKRHGSQMSDPFQLQVKVRTGPHANLMDVGYGVSQILPILVDVMHPDTGSRTFLLQQPEVHLHPRGQAALASLFVHSAKKQRNQFLIETHSDYIVDRVRICVRKKRIAPDDVSILYFEPRGNSVTIHNLSLDADGNLHDAPSAYREFFSRETDGLLGFTD